MKGLIITTVPETSEASTAKAAAGIFMVQGRELSWFQLCILYLCVCCLFPSAKKWRPSSRRVWSVGELKITGIKHVIPCSFKFEDQVWWLLETRPQSHSWFPNPSRCRSTLGRASLSCEAQDSETISVHRFTPEGFIVIAICCVVEAFWHLTFISKNTGGIEPQPRIAL